MGTWEEPSRSRFPLLNLFHAPWLMLAALGPASLPRRTRYTNQRFLKLRPASLNILKLQLPWATSPPRSAVSLHLAVSVHFATGVTRVPMPSAALTQFLPKLSAFWPFGTPCLEVEAVVPGWAFGRQRTTSRLDTDQTAFPVIEETITARYARASSRPCPFWLRPPGISLLTLFHTCL